MRTGVPQVNCWCKTYLQEKIAFEFGGNRGKSWRTKTGQNEACFKSIRRRYIYYVKKSMILSNWCKNHLCENHGLLGSAA